MSDSDVPLVLAPEVVVRLRGSAKVEISTARSRHYAGTRVLGVLEKFARPTSMRDFVQHVSAAGSEDFIEATSLAARMFEEGVLVRAGEHVPRKTSGFEQPWIHVAMLNDSTRTKAFADAIRQLVHRGDVVIDIGTGTGVLAVEAARAGARCVYAIEESSIADAAEQIFRANGVSDRVKIVRGRSTTIELPEKADVLVSETIGNDPLAEDVISIFGDARRRLAKPACHFIPRSLDVFALPIDIPDEFLCKYSFSEKNVSHWQALFGIDFRPLATFAEQIVALPNVKPQDVKSWPAIGAPFLLARVDLSNGDATADTKVIRFIADRDARHLGFLVYFESALSTGISISTSPSAAADDNCWTCCLFRAVERPMVSAGQTIGVRFSSALGLSDIHAISAGHDSSERSEEQR